MTTRGKSARGRTRPPRSHSGNRGADLREVLS